LDYTLVFYLTDTGLKRNHAGASIRDRVASGGDIPMKSTAHLATLAQQGQLTDKIMINIYPQRWHDRSLPWLKELVWRNVKNAVKRAGVRLGLLAYWWGQACVIVVIGGVGIGCHLGC
jgi:hypothetical protein